MPEQRTTGIEVIARGVAMAAERVLLCVNEAEGYAYLPGGHVEAGESAAAALARELLEETGARATIGPLMMVQEHRFEQEGKRRHEINLVFHVERLAGAGGRESPQPTDASAPPTIASLEPSIAFEWVELAELRRVNLHPVSIRSWLASVSQTPAGSPSKGAGSLAIAWRSDAVS